MVKLEDLRDCNNPINDSFNKLLGEVREEKSDKLEQDNLLTARVFEELIMFISRKEQYACCPPYNIPKKRRTPVGRKSSEKRRRFEGENSTTTEEREAKKAKNKNNEKDSAPPELPAEFKNMIIEGKNGKDITLVIQKRLFDTDMSSRHNRLSIPSGQVKSDFLFESEEKELVGEGIIVPMIEPCLEESADRLRLKRWNMGKTSPLALITGWNDIKSKNKNGLEKSVQVQLWSYRIQKQLCFALVKVEDSASTSKGNMVLGQVPVIAMAHEQADSYGNT